MSTLAGGQDWTEAHERSNVLALRTIAWIAVHLGRPVARVLLHPIVAYFLLFAPAGRRHSRRFLARALGRPARLAEVYRHLHTFASVALDRIWFARGDMNAFELEVHGGPLVDEVLAEGRGAFLIGAHVGSFEALHAVGATRPGMRVAMVMYPQNARKVQQVLHALAPGSALDVIPIGHARSALAVRDWLETGGLTGLLGDRFTAVDGAHAGSVERDFLGRPARFTDGPLRLALLLRRPVLFMVALYRGGRRYEVRFERLADFRTLPADAAQREALLQAALTDYVQRLEALCRESPWNWFNFFDYWGEDGRP